MRRFLLVALTLAALVAPATAAAQASPAVGVRWGAIGDGHKWNTTAGGLAAQEVPNYITGCSGHLIQAQHVTAAGNRYRLEGHLCLEVGDEVNNQLAVNTRWHGHCTRNGASWDGCRVNTELVVEFQTSSGAWQDRGATAFDITEPNSGYFADSQTRVSFADRFADELHVRAKAEDPDNMRFLLADDTTVLQDMLDAAGPGIEVCTIDPC